jgi:hypothetical protein
MNGKTVGPSDCLTSSFRRLALQPCGPIPTAKANAAANNLNISVSNLHRRRSTTDSSRRQWQSWLPQRLPKHGEWPLAAEDTSSFGKLRTSGCGAQPAAAIARERLQFAFRSFSVVWMSYWFFHRVGPLV